MVLAIESNELSGLLGGGYQPSKLSETGSTPSVRSIYAISSAVERVPYKHRVGSAILSSRTRQMRSASLRRLPTVVGDDGRYRNLPQSANVPRRRQGLQSPVAGFDSLGARQNRCEVTGVVTAPAVNRVFVGSIPTLTAKLPGSLIWQSRRLIPAQKQPADNRSSGGSSPSPATNKE